MTNFPVSMNNLFLEQKFGGTEVSRPKHLQVDFLQGEQLILNLCCNQEYREIKPSYIVTAGRKRTNEYLLLHISSYISCQKKIFLVKISLLNLSPEGSWCSIESSGVPERKITQCDDMFYFLSNNSRNRS